MTAKDIKVGSEWRPKAAPEYPVTIVRVRKKGIRYESPESGFLHWVRMDDWLRDWEPVVGPA